MTPEVKVQTPEWQVRLVEERKELLDRTIKLKNFMDSEEAKLNKKEWDMLYCQFYAMKGYLQHMTNRCVYYKLIPAGDLGLSYKGI